MPLSTETYTLLQRGRIKQCWRWLVLATFCFFSFSSALMWITFAPCLYIFVDYFFHDATPITVNAINSLSAVYMLVYPFVIQVSFRFFKDKAASPVLGSGLKQGILIGAVINAVAAAVRWLGASPSAQGFAILFVGQTLAAIAQVFILSVPPRLAVSWFPEDEINLATAIAVSANNLGVAAGCLWTPVAVKQDTMYTDIPHLMLIQWLMCLVVLCLITLAFQASPPYPARDDTEESSSDTAFHLLKQKTFIFMLVAYGAIMSSQCAVITLLAQILLPPFAHQVDEQFIGFLGAAMLFVGVPASILAGCYLDRTRKYHFACSFLAALSACSILGLYISSELEILAGVVVSCVSFGVASYAIAPAIFQFASELYYPVSEIIPTGFLYTVGNMSGVLLVALMGWNENTAGGFSMRVPMISLTFFCFVGAAFMSRVKGNLKRSSSTLP